jgi:hypothetical protein
LRQSTYYFDGRAYAAAQRLTNRVMIAIQNPGVLSKGALADRRRLLRHAQRLQRHAGSFPSPAIGGALPITIQNMPEEQFGAVYGAGDGSLDLINYAARRPRHRERPERPSSSIFITRNGNYVFAASQASHVFTVVNQAGARIASEPSRRVPRQRESRRLCCAGLRPELQLRLLPAAAHRRADHRFLRRPSTWPKGRVDCEPQNAPSWCLFQMQSPDHTDATGNYYGAPLTFDRPIKAVFSADGSTAYILSCGPECGGPTAAYTPVPIAPMIFLQGQWSGLLPNTDRSRTSRATVPFPAGPATRWSIHHHVRRGPAAAADQPGTNSFAGNLTVVNLANNTAGSPVAISDGQPGATSRMIEADDNTLWIGDDRCTTGVRYATNPASGYGCLTMYNTSTNKVCCSSRTSATRPALPRSPACTRSTRPKAGRCTSTPPSTARRSTTST